MRIGFRVDSSFQMGGGHVSRCMSLAAELEARGFDIVFFCRALAGDFTDKIKARYRCIIFETNDPIELDFDTEIALIDNHIKDEGTFDWLIIDHYNITLEWETAARKIARKIFVIDDFVNRKHDCDIFLNQSTADVTDEQADQINSVSFLLGPSYALLDRNILKFRMSKVGGPKNNYSLVIDFGSYNNLGAFVDVIETVKSLEREDMWIETDIMVGRNEQLFKALKQRFDGVENLKFHSFTNSYLQLLAKSDIAVGSCGVTSLERCCLGIPSFVIPIADNQLLLLDMLLQNESVKLVGGLNYIDTVLLESSLRGFFNDGIDLSWSESCKKSVDGEGVKRVADILSISNLTHIQLRRAVETDNLLLFEWKNERAARKYSITQDKLEIGNHEKWFMGKLKDEGCQLFILETQNKIPIGQIRFDYNDMGWELSYSIDSKYRNNGFGKKIIQMGLKSLSVPAPYVVYGRVTKNNQISNKIFNTLGFTIEPQSSDILVYKKEYSL